MGRTGVNIEPYEKNNVYYRVKRGMGIHQTNFETY